MQRVLGFWQRTTCPKPYRSGQGYLELLLPTKEEISHRQRSLLLTTQQPTKEDSAFSTFLIHLPEDLVFQMIRVLGKFPGPLTSDLMYL